MTFKKSFPHQKAEGAFTNWVEIALSNDDEKKAQDKARDEQVATYNQCLDDAREILLKNGMKAFDPNMIAVANALFEKRASHTVYYKEEAARDKFDTLK